MNSVSPSFGSRNRNIKKGRGRVTGPRAMHGTISCIVRTGPCRHDARNSNNRCAIRVDIYGHVRQGNWVRKIHPRDSAVIGYTSNERRGGELESEKRYRHADSRLRRDFSNANWPTLIFRNGRISNRWIVVGNRVTSWGMRDE